MRHTLVASQVSLALVMLAGAVMAVTAIGAKGQQQAGNAKRGEPDKSRFTGRMEERFRRRFEQE